MHLLIVEPDAGISWRLSEACGPDVRVTSCGTFQAARARMLQEPPDVLVSNLRLAEYNGLQLVILAHTAQTVVSHCIIHTDRPDFILIREAQALGAFYERTERLPFALPAYLRSSWPPADRRNPQQFDRRAVFRSGRRASDIAGLGPLT